MVDEAPTPYRYGMWGGATAPGRHELAATLAHPAVGEYLAHLHAAVEAWTNPRVTSTAQEATDAA